ncbi:LysR family transcriptional regulator [Pseudomonas protegens]|uniref:LysR family transcriptional regulator n=1 Tax=Pseudomonas protegens TaxID=380021 RepID=A0A2T6GSE6_9PSED|nr:MULTISPECIES: LysR family transcriptional regulator [Pseudomonas]PUA47078.1 LysR family transcriptional regulator [Pseudomonas protegens]ULT68089.1 LysR family transcriptional regulator [Pseudomonas sp. BC42]
MDKLKSMAAFVAAAEADSFSAAAAMLGVTPQLIAKQVGNLESQLGIKLITRTTRRQSLTAVGREYYSRCKAILSDVEDADELAQSANSTPRGKIRISAPYNYGSHRLIPFLTQFLTRYPETEIELELTDRFVNIVEEGYEVVFRLGKPQLADSATLVQRGLRPFRMFACASPAYLSRKGTPLHPEQLVDHDCLGYLFSDRMTDKLWRFTQNRQTFTIPITSRLKVNNTQAKVNAALSDFGITLCVEDVLMPYVQRGELVVLFEEFEGPTYPVNLIYPFDRRPCAKLRHFIDEVVEALGAPQA